jgi:hypothetical protein
VYDNISTCGDNAFNHKSGRSSQCILTINSKNFMAAKKKAAKKVAKKVVKKAAKKVAKKKVAKKKK